jgi:hypothetical protein
MRWDAQYDWHHVEVCGAVVPNMGRATLNAPALHFTFEPAFWNN